MSLFVKDRMRCIPMPREVHGIVKHSWVGKSNLTKHNILLNFGHRSPSGESGPSRDGCANNIQMSIKLATIKKTSRAISNQIGSLRKKLFELEVLHSKWESDHGLGKVYNSADDLMADILKKTTVYF